MSKAKIYLSTFLLVVNVFLPRIILAEAIPDNSLGANNSLVTPSQLIKGLQSEVINGGRQEGGTLFHSLQKLNIDTNNAIYFINPATINLIITRITGDRASYINGTLGVLGTADLFLINPNGVIFGSNSQLDLNGSFIVSTADSVSFPGYEFSASEANSIPILSVNIPSGLNFKQNTGIIKINNIGFQIYQPINTTESPSAISQPPNGLSVKPGRSFVIIGGEDQFNGAVINSVANILNIGAVKNGFVGINNSITGIKIDYSKVLDFGDINFDNGSFINNTGFGFGEVSIYGNNINLIGNSAIVSNNVGFTPISDLNIVAKNNLIISGNPNVIIPSGFSTIISGIVSNTDSSSGSDINISANNLIVENSATILARTFGSGQGGNISFNIENSAQLRGVLSFPSIGTTIATATSGKGNSGNINFNTDSLDIKDGSVIGTASYSSGKSGDINIFSRKINLSGYSVKTFLPSYILSVALNKGNSGNILVKTLEFSILNGAQLSSNSRGTGSPGDITVLSENLLISGSSPSQINGSSGIFSAAFLVDPNINVTNPQIDFNLSNQSTTSGNINILSKTIRILDSGKISTQNDSKGTGGGIDINASDALFLQKSAINASTLNGNGGIINISTPKLISQNSSISASAGGSGNGGNLSINSNVIFGDSSSFLSANAEQGLGGQIKIQSTGFIFPRNNITAKSNAGSSSDGRVVISASATQVNQSSLYNPALAQLEFLKGCKPDQRKSLEVINGSGTAPEQMTDPIETFSSSQNTYYRLDLKTRQKIPLGKPMLSWKDNGNGTSSAIAELAEPDSVSSLPTFYCFESNSNSAKAK